jgi:hypothetical protein
VLPTVPAIIPSAASRFIVPSPPSEVGASMPAGASVSANASRLHAFRVQKDRAPQRLNRDESARGALRRQRGTYGWRRGSLEGSRNAQQDLTRAESAGGAHGTFRSFGYLDASRIV